MRFDPAGKLISRGRASSAQKGAVAADRGRPGVRAVPDAKPVYEPGKMANWIAPPKQGIKGRPVDFEYVRHDAR